MSGDTVGEAEKDWVLPAGIPFTDLKSRDLEECVYWLLDAMGARDLEWRTGGSGAGAADGGRDLEATFYVPSPDGDMEPQRWWIECKGRKDTLEADAVKTAVRNALNDLSYLVVVTNTTFSNPTRDWVKAWLQSNPRPRIKLWDRESLERLLSRHPTVVLRLFSEALSPAGLLKVMEQKFWTKLEYTPIRALQTFWRQRGSIEIDLMARFALIANEATHGSLVDRPWAAQAAPEERARLLSVVCQNLAYLRLATLKFGAAQEPILAAVAHLIIVLLQDFSAVDVANLIVSSIGNTAKEKGLSVPENVMNVLLMPVLDRVAGEMQDVCIADCDRIHALVDRTTLGEGHDPIASYWRRFNPEGATDETQPKTNGFLEKLDAPCRVGFDVGETRGCPLYEIEPALGNIPEFLAVIERVSGFRLSKAKIDKASTPASP